MGTAADGTIAWTMAPAGSGMLPYCKRGVAADEFTRVVLDLPLLMPTVRVTFRGRRNTDFRPLFGLLARVKQTLCD